jgi:hypothetical protein
VNRIDRSYEVGDNIFLQVKSHKSAKLSPRKE